MVHFHYGPSAHLPQLPTPPRGDAVEVVFRREQPNSTGGTFTRVPTNFTGATHDKLFASALAMKSTALLQRLGFLSDLVGQPLPAALRLKVRDAIPPSRRSFFGREERKEGDVGYVAAWGVFVHARRGDLLSEVPRLKAESAALC